VVQTKSDLSGDVLLGVLWAERRKEPFQCGEVAGRRGRLDAVIQGHQV
jgi:hypothetical protein